MTTSRDTAVLKLALLIIAVVGLLGVPLYGEGQSDLRVGLIPFVNYSGSNEAVDSLMPLIESQLQQHGFTLIPHDTLRDLMRHQRMRMMGMITSRDAKVLRETLHLDYLITGSFDFFTPQANPEVGLSIRIFDCQNLQVVWAGSHAATASDYTKLFGLGRVKSISVLAHRVIDELFAEFPFTNGPVLSSRKTTLAAIAKGDSLLTKSTSPERVAIVTFDNNSGEIRAGEIASTLLLSELWKQNLQLVELGDVQQLLTELRTVPRGEITFEEASQIHDKLGASLIVTGSIYKFSSVSISEAGSVPEVEISMRLINAATGRIIASGSIYRSGGDSEKFFGTGIKYSLGKITQECLRSNWKTLTQERANHLSLASRTGKESHAENGTH